MYCVIEMYGDYEPWWFLDGWEEDIVAKKQFDDYYEALKYYKSRWLQMEEQSPLYKSRSDLRQFFGIRRISAGARSAMRMFSSTTRCFCWRMIARFLRASTGQAILSRTVLKSTELAQSN